MKKIAIYATGALVGAAAAIWLWWAFQLPWWMGDIATLLFASLSALWLGLQFDGQEQSVSLRNPIKFIWIFEGMSWISLAASVMLPLVCWFLIPQYRIDDPIESKALAGRVSRLIFQHPA